MISTLPSLAKAAEAIRSGLLAPVDLLDFCLARIRKCEPQVRAWVSVDEVGARREAERQTELARRREFIGPLHGIPIGIKDIVDVAGWPTKCGSPLRQNHVAADDAEVVARLRAAGAIILGKTVTTQFASFDPPPTGNPWNLARTPGGSSSGSAAAVSLEMCMAAIGTQTGGSIARPASYCGVVGFKPTYGAVSLHGIEPLAWNMDHAGPIARCVDDARVMFQVMSHQPQSAITPGEKPKLVRLTGFFDERCHDEIRQSFSLAIKSLQDGGLSVASRPDRPVDFANISASHRRVITVETAAHHRAAYTASRDQFGPCIQQIIDEGLQSTAVDYAAALRHQVRVQSELAPLFEGGQILILPSTTTAAPPRETTGDPAFNSLWSFARIPELTIPCGLTDNGLPCGVQLVGPAGSESRLFAIASLCESILQFQNRPAIP